MTTEAICTIDGAGIKEQGDTSGGLDWLTKMAAGSSACPTTAGPNVLPTHATPEMSEEQNEGEGLSWLTSVTSGNAQAKTTRSLGAPLTNSIKPKSIATAAAPGEWMTSAKLDLGSDVEGNYSSATVDGSVKAKKMGEGSTKAQARKGKKVPQDPDTSGPGGWLTSGTLGISADDKSDVEDQEDTGDGKVLVSIETQTDDDIEVIVERGRELKFPPWAKQWIPPPSEPATAVFNPATIPKNGEESGEKVI